MQSDKPVTAWYRYNPKTKEYNFNHLEDDHMLSDFPAPIFKTQFVWAKQIWRRDHGYVIDDRFEKC